MAETPAPLTAVQIVAAAIAGHTSFVPHVTVSNIAVAALHEHGLLVDPARLAALEAVAEAAPDVLAQLDVYARMKITSRRLQCALDALPARD